jgi:hypothetical protein
MGIREEGQNSFREEGQKRDRRCYDAFVKRDRTIFVAVCQKVKQSIHVVWRQKLDDGTQLEIPEDPRLPPIVVYGSKAELRLLYGGIHTRLRGEYGHAA